MEYGWCLKLQSQIFVSFIFQSFDSPFPAIILLPFPLLEGWDMWLVVPWGTWLMDTDRVHIQTAVARMVQGVSPRSQSNTLKVHGFAAWIIQFGTVEKNGDACLQRAEPWLAVKRWSHSCCVIQQGKRVQLPKSPIFQLLPSLTSHYSSIRHFYLFLAWWLQPRNPSPCFSFLPAPPFMSLLCL